MALRTALVAVIAVVLSAALPAGAAAGWATVPPPVAGQEVTALRAVDARCAWATAAGSLWRTADGGATWDEVKPPAEPFTLLQADGPGSAWVTSPSGTDPCLRRLFRTDDGGETWAETSAPGTGMYYYTVAPGEPDYYEVWTSLSVAGPWFADGGDGFCAEAWEQWIWGPMWGYIPLGSGATLRHTRSGGGAWHVEYATARDGDGNLTTGPPHFSGRCFPQADASFAAVLDWPTRGLAVSLAPDGSPLRWATAFPAVDDQTPVLLRLAAAGRVFWGNAAGTGDATRNLWWSDDGASWTRARVGLLTSWRAVDLCFLADGLHGFLLLAFDDGSWAVYGTADGGGSWQETGLGGAGWAADDCRLVPCEGGASAWFVGPGLLCRYTVDEDDVRAPVTAVAGDDGDWHREPVTLTFSASDDRPGPVVVQCREAGKPWRAATTLTIGPGKRGANSGVHTVLYRAVDAAGNLEQTHLCQVRIDARPPRTVDDAPAAPIADDTVITLTAEDPLSGVAATCWALDGGAWHSGSEVPVRLGGKRRLTPGTHWLAYFSVDAAGNQEPLRLAVFTVAAG